MPKSNLCEDRTAKQISGVRKLIAGGLSDKNFEEISKKTGIPVRTLNDYIGKNGDLTNASVGRLFTLADMAGVKIKFTLKDLE